MKFGIIGYGNLGKALVQGLLCAGIYPQDIVINARTEKTRNMVKEQLENICVTESKEQLLAWSDVVILVVEPKNAFEVLSELANYHIEDKTIVSFMAGISRQEIRQMLGMQGKTVKVIRVMPNIAIANANGILGMTYEETDYEEIQNVITVFEKLGYVLKLEEEQLDYVTVTAASGLAFVASLMNSYQSACKVLLDNDIQSKEITLRVFENVIDIVKKENCSFEDVMKRITTKGGTTEAGMNCLNQEAITNTLEDCVKNSYNKCRKIL